MNFRRITVPLSEAELKALAQMALTACRQPREQARFIIHEAARQRGLLSEPESVTGPENQESTSYATNK